MLGPRTRIPRPWHCVLAYQKGICASQERLHLHHRVKVKQAENKNPPAPWALEPEVLADTNRAGDGARTRDPRFTRALRYQLCHSSSACYGT